MQYRADPQLIQNLQAHGALVLSLDEYKAKIEQWGFTINIPKLELMKCANSDRVNGAHFGYFHTHAVLTETIQGRYIGYANQEGYQIIPKNDDRRKAFMEFLRSNQVYFIYKNELFTV